MIMVLQVVPPRQASQTSVAASKPAVKKASVAQPGGAAKSLAKKASDVSKTPNARKTSTAVKKGEPPKVSFCPLFESKYSLQKKMKLMNIEELKKLKDHPFGYAAFNMARGMSYLKFCVFVTVTERGKRVSLSSLVSVYAYAMLPLKNVYDLRNSHINEVFMKKS